MGLISRAVEIFADLPPRRVDEYGFGTTHFAEMLKTTACKWRGFDFSPVAVENAKAAGFNAGVRSVLQADLVRRSYICAIAVLPNLSTEDRDTFLDRVKNSPHAVFGIKRHQVGAVSAYASAWAFAEFLRKWWPYVTAEGVGEDGILAHCSHSVPETPPILTVGSSTLLDFRGVCDTFAGLQTNHGEFGGKVEYALVDNHPDADKRLRGCPECNKLKKDGPVCATCAKDIEDMEICATSEGARYIRWADKQGTYPGKNQLKVEARGKWVLTMDSHVKLTPWAIEECLELIERDPMCDDLFQFANMFRSGNPKHAGRPASSDFRNQQFIYHDGKKRGGVYGWTGKAKEAGEPYDIGAMITSCYLVRKAAWFSGHGYDPILGNYGGWEGPLQLKWYLLGRRVKSIRYSDPYRLKHSPQGFMYHWHLFNHFKRLANATGRVHTGRTKMRNFAASSAVIGGEPWVRRHCELKGWNFDSDVIQTGFKAGMELRPWMVENLARPEWEDITVFFQWMLDQGIPGALRSW